MLPLMISGQSLEAFDLHKTYMNLQTFEAKAETLFQIADEIFASKKRIVIYSQLTTTVILLLANIGYQYTLNRKL